MEAKKSLGQNFLRDPKILKKIANFAKIENTDTVFEVGPGEGGLTEILLEQANKVISIEKDSRIIGVLRNKFKKEISENKLEVMEADILEYEIDSTEYKLVGNIPYYITGALFKKSLESKLPPKSLTFVVQREVAERIMADKEKESLLSISIKAYGDPSFGGVIKAGSFYPAPKVDSAIIAIRNINKGKFLSRNLDEKYFFEILRAGFAHKRKFLIKNLEALSSDPKNIAGVFNDLAISIKSRAEDLKTEDWFNIAEDLKRRL